MGKPVIVVSKCLGFDACRYDGQQLESPFVQELRKHVTICTVCPELEIGLGVPRLPIKIVEKSGDRRLLQTETLKDLTQEMHHFSETFLRSLHEADGFILKSRS